ncbi:MAG TPA: hypothetical protein VND93_08405 [Myxococcales bacterium]|nr:hypothetical protein [Myxococcales bacterium]
MSSLLAACAPAGLSHRTGPALTLPPELEPQRARYQADIDAALEDVTRWFSEQEVQTPAGPLVREVVVLGGDAAAVRRAFAERFGMSEAQVPDGFSGTTDGAVLFLVSRETYQATFRRLYPKETWAEGEYRRLATHEVAHRAHELAAVSLTGSSEGMGPRWFFEGLALACAGQFQASSPGRLQWKEVTALIKEDAKHPLGYPRYADMFRSAARMVPVKNLVARAGAPDFAEWVAARAALRQPR